MSSRIYLLADVKTLNQTLVNDALLWVPSNAGGNWVQTNLVIKNTPLCPDFDESRVGNIHSPVPADFGAATLRNACLKGRSSNCEELAPDPFFATLSDAIVPATRVQSLSPSSY
jgi:hypothetical protein